MFGGYLRPLRQYRFGDVHGMCVVDNDLESYCRVVLFHTQAFEPGHPGLLTECYDDRGQKNGKHGPMDPSKPAVYQFVEAFFEEITQVFPEKYLHLGGDEVDFECW